MRFLIRLTPRLLLICFLAPFASAGGPLVVGAGPAAGTRPAFGIDGKPFTWNPAKMPIQYRIDPGPMAANTSGTTVIDHASGVQRVQGMFGVWQSTPTASLSFSNAGNLLPAGAYTSGDLSSAQQFDAVIGSCDPVHKIPSSSMPMAVCSTLSAFLPRSSGSTPVAPSTLPMDISPAPPSS